MLHSAPSRRWRDWLAEVLGLVTTALALIGIRHFRTRHESDVLVRHAALSDVQGHDREDH
jgi:hypothetical protein